MINEVAWLDNREPRLKIGISTNHLIPAQREEQLNTLYFLYLDYRATNSTTLIYDSSIDNNLEIHCTH